MLSIVQFTMIKNGLFRVIALERTCCFVCCRRLNDLKQILSRHRVFSLEKNQETSESNIQARSVGELDTPS